MSIGDVDDITLPENSVEITASVDSTETGILKYVSCPNRNKRYCVLRDIVYYSKHKM